MPRKPDEDGTKESDMDATRIPQVGDTIRHLTKPDYYGEGTVQSLGGAAGTHISVYFPKLAFTCTFRRDDPALEAREPTPAPAASAPAARPAGARKPAPQQAPRKPGKPTDKQVRYAMSLLAKVQEPDDGSFGPADDAATRRSLERMTPAQVSALISDLRKRLG